MFCCPQLDFKKESISPTRASGLIRKIQGMPPGIRRFLLYLSDTANSRCAPNHDFADDLIESQSISSKTIYPWDQKEGEISSRAPRSHMLAT